MFQHRSFIAIFCVLIVFWASLCVTGELSSCPLHINKLGEFGI